jgi:aldose 1-epimerase
MSATVPPPDRLGTPTRSLRSPAVSERPSGEQFEIRYGDQIAVVTEVGATLRHYEVAGRPLLDGFGPDEVCSAGRGQHLVPWPNRIRDGRYQHAGQTHQLALTEPAKHNAIHGLARWADWRLAAQTDSSVTLTLAIHPQPGWPTTLAVTVLVELGDEGLAVTTSALNSGPVSAPYGTGAHPYLTLGADRVDTATIEVPAATYLRPDDRGIPADPQPVDGTPYDFRSPRPVGDLVLDTAFTDVQRDQDRRWQVRMSDPETGRAVSLWADEAYGWIQLFTGDTLPPGKARAGLAVEPMTCGPDAFNTGVGLVILEPGQSHRARWGITGE